MGLPVSVHLRGRGHRTRTPSGRGAGLRRAPRGRRAVQHVPAGERGGAAAPRRDRDGRRGTARARGHRPLRGGAPRTAGAFGAFRRAAARRSAGFDPSGLVKGWAVDRAARSSGAPRARVRLNAGGDVVSAAGTPGRRPRWRIGIEDPRDRSRLPTWSTRRRARSRRPARRRGASTSSTRPGGDRVRVTARSPWSARRCSGPTSAPPPCSWGRRGRNASARRTARISARHPACCSAVRGPRRHTVTDHRRRWSVGPGRPETGRRPPVTAQAVSPAPPPAGRSR